MILLTAKPLVNQMKAQLYERVLNLTKELGRKPQLAVILVGEDPASIIYTRNKGMMATELGMDHQTISFPLSVLPNVVQDQISKLNADNSVDGILIQRPLPPHFVEAQVLSWITPGKDVDAFHPENAGRLQLGLPCLRPCTPAGIIELLNYYQIPLSGKTACVVGRSSIVGKPMAALLLQSNCTVIQTHSHTQNLKQMTSQADLLIAAAGKPGLITSEHVKPGSIVIDVGIHRVQQNGPQTRIVGDVQFDEVSKRVAAITPVPGGVGPMTIMMLMNNTINSAMNKIST